MRRRGGATQKTVAKLLFSGKYVVTKLGGEVTISYCDWSAQDYRVFSATAVFSERTTTIAIIGS